MKVKKLLVKIFNTKKKIAIAAGIVVLFLVLTIAIPLMHKEERKVDTSYMLTLLSESSELTTAKLRYTGMTQYEDTGVAFLNKSNFTMVYEATARIGIDVEEVKVRADDVNKKIHVTVPSASVQEVHVDTSTIKYFDEKFSLFNFDEKEDSNQAIAMIEQEAREEINTMGVLEMADVQAASLIKGILANAVPDGYTIEVDKK